MADSICGRLLSMGSQPNRRKNKRPHKSVKTVFSVALLLTWPLPRVFQTIVCYIRKHNENYNIRLFFRLPRFESVFRLGGVNRSAWKHPSGSVDMMMNLILKSGQTAFDHQYAFLPGPFILCFMHIAYGRYGGIEKHDSSIARQRQRGAGLRLNPGARAVADLQSAASCGAPCSDAAFLCPCILPRAVRLLPPSRMAAFRNRHENACGGRLSEKTADPPQARHWFPASCAMHPFEALFSVLSCLRQSSGRLNSSVTISSSPVSGSLCTAINSERYASSGRPASRAGRLMMMPSMR